MSNRTVRAAIAAVAGTTVGVGAVAVATPAHASTVPITARAGSLPICDSWSYSAVVSGTGDNRQFANQYIPTAGHSTFNMNCVLDQNPNNVLDGVFKLQLALNKCYNAGLDTDGRYGQLTANAVRKVQAAHSGKVAQTGVFERNTSAVMLWPVFSSQGDFLECALHPPVL